jgi:large subunit ribosomal protein L18
MRPLLKKIEQRKRRKKHVRRRVVGSPERPRLTVFRSNKNIYAQLIDDEAGHTLASASTTEKALGGELDQTGDQGAAKKVGQAIAAKAAEKGIRKVTFDRNGYHFHGRVRALAEGAREGGLQF